MLDLRHLVSRHDDVAERLRADRVERVDAELDLRHALDPVALADEDRRFVRETLELDVQRPELLVHGAEHQLVLYAPAVTTTVDLHGLLPRLSYSFAGVRPFPHSAIRGVLWREGRVGVTPRDNQEGTTVSCATVQRLTNAMTQPLERPLLRGVLHEVAFFVALIAGILLVTHADGVRASAAAGVFAASVVAMLGASTLYHRVTWSVRVRPWMRRLDHAGIYLLIAGTYTPVGLLTLRGTMRDVVLGIVWSGAAVAILLRFVWLGAPKWLSAVIGVALGWAGVAAMPQIARHAGAAAVTLLAIGGLAYTAGAIVYARRRPDPVPSVFGYHELFHALTIVAVSCQYVAIAFFIVRVG